MAVGDGTEWVLVGGAGQTLQLDNGPATASPTFMGLPGDGDRLELTYNFGIDSYELGTGYAQVAVTVDDIAATLDRLAGEGIEPERPPYTVREGGPLICFVPDPDGNRSVANCAESGLFPGTLAVSGSSRSVI